LLALQDQLPGSFMVIAGNGCLMFGLALYWRSVRRFEAVPDSPWIFTPVVLGVMGIFWFAAITPNFSAPVLVATLAWIAPLIGAGWLLVKPRAEQRFISRSVLAAIMSLVMATMLLRAVYFLAHPYRAASILSDDLVSGTTPFLLCLLPVIGTTCFLMMCSERAQRLWQKAAATDFLTGLPNRRTISATAKARISAARRQGIGLVIAIIDIDHFKSINDRFGHEAGDRALKHVADVLSKNSRSANMVGRIGGEEFVVLIEGSSLQEALVAAERLRVALELAPVVINDQPLTLTVSIGLSELLSSDLDFSTILGRADSAMYQAKKNGRNRVEVYQGPELAAVA
jgi:diguanylate cyclase (GGDEF)-like protein